MPSGRIAASSLLAPETGAGGGFRFEALSGLPATETFGAVAGSHAGGSRHCPRAGFWFRERQQQVARLRSAGPVRDSPRLQRQWYAAAADGIASLEGESGKLVGHRVWTKPVGATVLDFDAAAGSFAIVTDREALWCNLPAGKDVLNCETLSTDEPASRGRFMEALSSVELTETITYRFDHDRWHGYTILLYVLFGRSGGPGWDHDQPILVGNYRHSGRRSHLPHRA